MRAFEPVPESSFVAINFVVDVLAVAIDPRLKLAGA